MFLALALATVLRPPAAWLIARGWPPLPAALLVLLVALAVLVGLAVVLAPAVVGQIGAIVQGVVGGLGEIRAWLAGPPFNLGSGQVGAILDMLTQQAQQSASTIASTALTAVGTITSSIANLLLALVLTFLFVKDGARVLPWVHRWAGTPAGPHVGEVLARSWNTLGNFIRAQALVGLIDGGLIGIGLAVVGVPLAVPLGVLTFLAAFVPYLGAIVAGALAVLVALFSQGLTSALVVLAIVLVVQQLEGNVLAPLLQSHNLGLHPAVILLAVVVGWSLYGVIGALLAVPVTAVAATVANYLREEADARAGTEARPRGA